MQLLWIGLCGALGAISRYAISGWTYALCGDRFPYGTLAVNIIGCFALGFLVHVGEATDVVPPAWRVSISIGFLGALTTFSTFGHETFQQLQESQWLLALANIAANVVVGLAGVWIGISAARALVGGA